MDLEDRDRAAQTECDRVDRGQVGRVVRAVLGQDRVEDDRVAQVSSTELLMSE